MAKKFKTAGAVSVWEKEEETSGQGRVSRMRGNSKNVNM
jgi:hypothetical protein